MSASLCVNRSAATDDGMTRYERTLPEMSIVAAAVCDAILENHYRLGGRTRCCSALAAAATRWCHCAACASWCLPCLSDTPVPAVPCRPACAAVCRAPPPANGFIIIIILFRRVYAHGFCR